MGTPRTVVVLVFLIGFAQSDVYKQLPFGRLLTKFTKVLDNMKANNGVISDTDKATLEELKKDMVEDCKAGKLHEYTGGQKYDIKNTPGIPTKVYHVRLSEEDGQDTYYWALPEVDCNGLDGRVNYESDDELDGNEDDSDSESGGSGSEASAGAQKQGKAKPGLAGDDEINGFLKKEHHRMDEENKKDKVSLKGVKKPPKPNKIHVQ